MNIYQWIADFFDALAKNEFAHARSTYKKYLDNVGSTEDNLQSGIEREEDVTELYKQFEKTAKSEDLDELSHFYKELSEAEESHIKIYTELYDMFKNGTVFSSPEPISWVCLNCGYIHEGTDAPKECPCYSFPQAYFKPKCIPEGTI